MSQRLLRVGLRLQAALDGRQHLFVQVQDVLNIGKQNLWDKSGYDVKEIRNRGRGRKREEGEARGGAARGAWRRGKEAADQEDGDGQNKGVNQRHREREKEEKSSNGCREDCRPGSP